MTPFPLFHSISFATRANVYIITRRRACRYAQVRRVRKHLVGDRAPTVEQRYKSKKYALVIMRIFSRRHDAHILHHASHLWIGTRSDKSFSQSGLYKSST